MDPVLEDVEAGQDDLLHAGEVILPDDLGLLPPAEHLRPRDGMQDLRDLQQLPLVDGEAGDISDVIQKLGFDLWVEGADRLQLLLAFLDQMKPKKQKL